MRHKRICYERLSIEEAVKRYLSARRKGKKVRAMVAGALADEIITREKEKGVLTMYFHNSIINVWRQLPIEAKHQVTAELERIIFIRGVDEGIVKLRINPDILKQGERNDEGGQPAPENNEAMISEIKNDEQKQESGV